jgi:membrane protein DedA with SNARE-associated domain
VLAASVLSELSDAITSAIGDYGLYAIFVLMLIDAVLPAASELVMVYGGALAAGAFANQDVTLFGRTIDEGLPAYVAVALAGTIGYTIGAIMGWAIGLYGGRPYLERHGRWLHLNEQKLDRAERWFERWENWAVFVGRLTPVIRSFVSVPAGVFEVPFVRYTLLTLLGSAIWCFAFAGAGYLAGSAWEDVHHAFGYVEYVVAAAVVVGVAWFAWRYLRRRRRRVAEESSVG